MKTKTEHIKIPRPISTSDTLKYFKKAVGDSLPTEAIKILPAEDLFCSEVPVSISDEIANQVIQTGLAATIVMMLGDALEEVDKKTLYRVIGIDKATLRRKEHDNKPLDQAQSEATVRTMELTALATETFGTLEKGTAWLAKPHPLLNNQRPIERASNQYGAAQVKSMLLAIRYGGVV